LFLVEHQQGDHFYLLNATTYHSCEQPFFDDSMELSTELGVLLNTEDTISFAWHCEDFFATCTYTLNTANQVARLYARRTLIKAWHCDLWQAF